MVLQFLLNMAACYLRMRNYKMVEQVMAEAARNTPKSAVLWYRRAQGLATDLGASLEDLQRAREYVLRAIECKKVEPTFQRGKFLLMSHNLHNADEAFADALRFIDTRFKQLKTHQEGKIREMVASLAEIIFINETEAAEREKWGKKGASQPKEEEDGAKMKNEELLVEEEVEEDCMENDVTFR
jgi:hypothetical protein